VAVKGTLAFVGTDVPLGGSAGSQARARVRIDKGTCDSTNNADGLYIIINSGVLDATSVAERNSLNMKNAYSTLLTALLSGKTVQIYGFTTCSANAAGEMTLALPNGNVNILQTPTS
jgi:hypothetical protein